MRTLVALAAIAVFAAPAPATSINPSPPGWAKASPSGQFVLVRVTPHGWRLEDHDAPAIRERCKTSGLYRRGEWDAPLWAFDTFGPWSVYLPSDDGVHLVEYSYLTPGYGLWFVKNSPEYHDAAYRRDAFTFYAGGKRVRAATLGEIAGDLDATLSTAKWFRSAEFHADGLFHVTAGDGNQTAFDPATGKRVRGVGVREPSGRVWWYAVAGVVIAVGVGLAVKRVRRAKAVKHAHA